MTYTVDEVSDLLGVPRPTLYRYLREYSIPHLRRSGKIFVPEDSFDRIKEVRELHKEGLATESVRRRLQEESSFDVDELAERLDRISERLEDLQGNLEPANGVSSAQALQTILERQSLLISAVYNLTEMLEDLLHPNGGPRKAPLADPEDETRDQNTLSKPFEGHPKTIDNDVTANEPVIAPSPKSMGSLAAPTRRSRFGAMGRRRRHVALVILLALLTSAALVTYALSDEGSGASQEETSELPYEVPSASEEVSAGESNATPSSSTGREEQESIGYAEEGYEESAPEQPLYETQLAAPGSLPQGPPMVQPQLQPPLDGAAVTPPLR